MSAGLHTEFPDAQRLIDQDHAIRRLESEVRHLRGENGRLKRDVEILTERGVGHG